MKNTYNDEDIKRIHSAVEKNDIAALTKVLESKISPDLKLNGRTPLHTAVLNNSIEAAQFLIANGAKVNLRDNEGRTPLILAAKEDRGYLIWSLLNENAKINEQDKYGMTALHYSTQNNSMDNIKTILNREPDTTIRDGRNRTPIDVAKEVRDKIRKEYGYRDYEPKGIGASYKLLISYNKSHGLDKNGNVLKHHKFSGFLSRLCCFEGKYETGKAKVEIER